MGAMATFDKLPSGRWRAQVRRKGQTASRSFRLKSDADAWAREAEDQIGRGKSIDAVHVDATTTFAEIIDLHIRDLAEVGKALLTGLTRERIIAGPEADLGADLEPVRRPISDSLSVEVLN